MDIPIEKIIDPREIRIGNILSYKGEPVHITHISLDIDDEYQETIGFCKLYTTSGEISDWNRALAADLDRIPITAEWLQRYGLKTLDYEIDLIEWGFHSGEPFGFSIFQHGVPPESAPFIFSYDVGHHAIQLPVLSIHQLQNLYYALSGQDLVANR